MSPDNADDTGLTIQYNIFNENSSSPPDGGSSTVLLGGNGTIFDNVTISNNYFNSCGNSIFEATTGTLSNVVIDENVFDGTIRPHHRQQWPYRRYAGLRLCPSEYGRRGNLQLTDNLFENSAGTAAAVGIVGGSAGYGQYVPGKCREGPVALGRHVGYGGFQQRGHRI